MTWQVIVSFIAGAIVGGVIAGFVAYKKGRKDEHSAWAFFRMKVP